MEVDENWWQWIKKDGSEGKNQNGCKWMKLDESRWIRIKVEESGWMWMKWMNIDESGWKGKKVLKSEWKGKKFDETAWSG